MRSPLFDSAIAENFLLMVQPSALRPQSWAIQAAVKLIDTVNSVALKGHGFSPRVNIRPSLPNSANATSVAGTKLIFSFAGN